MRDERLYQKITELIAHINDSDYQEMVAIGDKTVAVLELKKRAEFKTLEEILNRVRWDDNDTKNTALS